MTNIKRIILLLFFAFTGSALLFLPEGSTSDGQDIGFALLMAFAAAGGFLLRRFLFPFKFVLLPDWKTSYIIASGLFVLVLVSGLVMLSSPPSREHAVQFRPSSPR